MNELKILVEFDDALDALADIQRRTLLISLLDHNPQDDTPVVVGGTDSETGGPERLTTMRHVHLPKLVEYGFVEWDEAANEVAKGPQLRGDPAAAGTPRRPRRGTPCGLAVVPHPPCHVLRQ